MADIGGIIKPIFPRVNFGRKITQGLVFDAPLFEGIGLTTQELIQKIKGTLSGSGGPTWENQLYGKDLLFSDNTDILNFTSPAAVNSLAAMSLEILMFPTGVNAALDSRAIHKGPSAKYFNAGIETVGGNNVFNLRVGHATADLEAITGTLTMSKWYHFLTTMPDLTDTAGTAVKIYQNGISVPVTINTTGSGAKSTDSTDLGIGNRPVGGLTKGFVGKIAYVRLWNRVLGANEASMLARDPFLIYKPSPSFFFPSSPATTTKTQTGISRIAQITTKTQTGKANAVWDKTTQYDHVVVILMENQNYSDVIGNTTDAPYINNTLLPISSLLSNYFALAHPSLPNYLALISGSTQGVTDDHNVGPPDNAGTITATNLVDRLETASLSWKAYMEAMPSDWYTKSGRTMGNTGSNSFNGNAQYQEHHNPFVYFTSNNNVNTNTRLTKIVPYTQLATDLAVSGGGGLPKFSFITPQVDHDMHDQVNGSTTIIRSGDNWLSTEVANLINSDAFTKQKSLLLIIWDEDNGGSGQKVPCIAYGYNVRKNFTSSNTYDHYTALRTIEAALGHLTPMQTDGTKDSDLTATILSDIFLTSKDQTGVARIGLVTTKTQTGKSRITSVVGKLQTAVANIKNNTLRLQTAVARIQRTSGAIIDQQQIADTSFDFIIGWTSEQKDAQSFQPGFTGYLTKINVNLKKSGAPTDNVNMQIYSDNAGVPGSLLFSADSVVAAASISSSYGLFTFNFSTGQAIVAGTSYWIVLSRTGSLDNTNYYLVNGADSHSDQYIGGVNRFFDGSAWQDPDVGNFCDISFQEYYQPTITRGIARITQLVSRATTGIARVTDITQKLQTGKSRITQTVSKIITGVSRITDTTSRTIAGIGRVTQKTLQAITGKARITQLTLQTQTGVAHINAPGITTTTQTQPGKARITATTLRLQLAKARITVSTSQIMAAVARLIYTTARTITGKANITASTSRQKTITGVANIKNSLIQSTGWKAVTIPSTVWTKP